VSSVDLEATLAHAPVLEAAGLREFERAVSELGLN
jgi:hypothetical protein